MLLCAKCIKHSSKDLTGALKLRFVFTFYLLGEKIEKSFILFGEDVFKLTIYFKIKLKQLKVYVLHYCLLIVLQQIFLS